MMIDAYNSARDVRGRSDYLTWTRSALHAHGGFGYDHLMRSVAPALRERDVDPRPLLIDEPRRLLAR